MMNIKEADQKAMQIAAPAFSEAEKTAFFVTERVMEAFRRERVSEVHFADPPAMATAIAGGIRWNKFLPMRWRAKIAWCGRSLSPEHIR